MVLACKLISLFVVGSALNCSQLVHALQAGDPPPASSPSTPSDNLAAEVDRLFANWPYEVMTCKIAAEPKREVDQLTVTPDSEVRSSSDQTPDYVSFTWSVDIGLDDAKWQHWSQLAAASLKQLSIRQSSSQWSLSQSTAPRVDAKSGDGSHFLEAWGEVMSPEVKRLEHRLIRGVVERKDTPSKVKRKPGETPSMREVEIDAMRPLMEKVDAFAGWDKGKPEDQDSVCVSIQANDGAAVQHFLLPAGCHPDFAGLAHDDRVPVVELILKDKEGNRLPIHRGDKLGPHPYLGVLMKPLINNRNRWYFATPRFLVSSWMSFPSWRVSSPAITLNIGFELDREVAARLASYDARLVPGAPNTGLADPADHELYLKRNTDRATELPNATPPGLSAPAVPPKPSGPRVPRMPGPPPAIPR